MAKVNDLTAYPVTAPLLVDKFNFIKDGPPQSYRQGDFSSLQMLIEGGRTFDTRTTLAAATIVAGIDIVQTHGYTTIGDGGEATYKRVGSEPLHALKVQSVEGTWWELLPENGYINVKQAGAVGDDTTDDGQAFIDAINMVWFNSGGGSFGATHGVIVPTSNTAYYLGANTLELKAKVHLVGQGGGQAAGSGCQIRWDANITGIIIHADNTIGATTEVLTEPDANGNHGAGDGSVIEGLRLRSDGGTIAGVTDDTKGHGIWMRGKGVLTDMIIRDFPGNGINIVAAAGGAADVDGNSNLWRIDRVRVDSCHLSGLYVQGSDTNAGSCEGLDTSTNGRWGIWDDSSLGNTYIACHSANSGRANTGENGAGESSFVSFGANPNERRYAANVAASEQDLVDTTPGTDEDVWLDMVAGAPAGSIPLWVASQPLGTYFHGGAYHTSNGNGRSVFIGCYSESNQAPAQFTSVTNAMGGLHGASVRGALKWIGNDFTGAVAHFISPDETFGLDTLINPFKNVPFRFDLDGEEDAEPFMWNDTTKQWHMGASGNSITLAPIQIFNTDSTVVYGQSQAVVTGASFKFGIWPGADNMARKIIFANVVPSSGRTAEGDLFLGRSTSSNGVFAWTSTSQGAPGTMRALWKVPTVDSMMSLPQHTVANLPAAATANKDHVAYCSDGDAGSPCLAVSDGTNWLRVVFGAAVAAS